ncbi:MAG: nitroreductase/quinone reductase family protein [Candidatus Binataceae bacterium]|jgi:deazaflavin-dependent oxidoreductase (nitroreductase family)
MAQAQHFLKPSLTERIFNRVFAVAIGFGIGLGHNYVLEVRGRKSGRIFSAPIDLLEFDGRRYLVAPRGETNWVRNARAAGQVTLCKGRRREEFAVREVGPAQRPVLLKAYLDRFALTVQRYFPLPKESPASEFASIAERYPVFELTSAGMRRDRA